MPSFLKTADSYRQGARTLPGRYYTAPEVLTEEQERIFRRRWICVGRDNALAAPGDYMLVEIAGESIIVLRDQSGERRAFTAGPACAKPSAVASPRRSSAPITPGRTHWMDA